VSNNKNGRSERNKIRSRRDLRKRECICGHTWEEIGREVLVGRRTGVEGEVERINDRVFAL
jgi:hypothetical protein